MSGEGLVLHVLASGSDGNCAVLKADGVSVMIDAGLSGRNIAYLADRAGLDLREISGILLTHEHGDHVRGAGVISRRYDIPVYANRNTFQGSRLGNVGGFSEFHTLSPFSIGHLRINPLPIFHHALEPNAFVFDLEGRRCLVATDLGKVSRHVQMELGRSNLVMLEANHDVDMLIGGSYPPFLKTLIMGERGHLSNSDCAKALSRGGVDGREIFLAHMSKNNNRPDLARDTVGRSLGCDPAELHCLEDGGVCSISIP